MTAGELGGISRWFHDDGISLAQVIGGDKSPGTTKKERATMAKVYSIHSIALKHGRTPEEFECFWKDSFLAGPQIPGMTARLMRGDRGERKGQYVLMFEVESVETRNHLFPVEGPGAGVYSEEVGRWMANKAPSLPHWDKLATLFDQIFTDYVEVG
jgi:hypothetical protein